MTVTKKTFKLLCILLSGCIGLLTFFACKSTPSDDLSNIQYKIVFDSAGGTPTDTILAYNGEIISSPADPERNGYQFDGWYLDGIYYEFTVMPEENITLTAKWSQLYMITFTTEADATQIPPLALAEGQAIAYPATPTRPYYLFSKWMLGAVDVPYTVMPATDFTLTAKWDNAVTVFFDLDGGVGTHEYISGLIGTYMEAPTQPTKHGHRFMGWKRDGIDYTFPAPLTSSISLVAQWVAITYNNLPAIFIDLKSPTGNAISIDSVNRESYVQSYISVENIDSKNLLYNLSAQFKGRGNGSWSSDKRGYRIKFDSSQSLLGNSASRHWVLISCKSNDSTDVSMARNYSAFKLAKEVFNDIEYVTSAEWADIYFNGVYYGVYVVAEHVRVSDNRIDIESEYGVNDTGYLIEYDAYAMGTENVDYFNINGVKYGFSVKSPDPDDYRDYVTLSNYKDQIRYIQGETQKMISAALNGDFATFSALADVNSFVDMYLLHELYKNTDAGWSSFFICKKPGGKFYAVAPWDFDFSAGLHRGNPTYTGIYVSDSIFSESAHTASEMYIALMNSSKGQNAGFVNAVKARWQVLAPEIIKSLDNSTGILSDTIITQNNAALARNFNKWNGSNGETLWGNEVRSLRTWLQNRTTWLSSHWK